MKSFHPFLSSVHEVSPWEELIATLGADIHTRGKVVLVELSLLESTEHAFAVQASSPHCYVLAWSHSEQGVQSRHLYWNTSLIVPVHFIWALSTYLSHPCVYAYCLCTIYHYQCLSCVVKNINIIPAHAFHVHTVCFYLDTLYSCVINRGKLRK